MKQKQRMKRWTVEDSADLYQIREWGAGYFGISKTGDVIVTPLRGRKDVCVNLPEIISGITARGYDMPMLLRFEDILDSQIIHIHESFRSAIEKFGYKGEFKGVYPIKVNQQRQVVAKINEAGRPFNLGLEVGSKPELVAVLAIQDNPDAPL
ncbi:MAG: arginine decarboxylase, partial [Desulfomonilia bacterium]|nr:arginine decarboxylase [Desulfomonilia bacterium]